MSETLRAIVSAIIGAGAVYLTSAFAHADFNIAHWGGFERGMTAVFMLFFAGTAAIIGKDEWQ